MKIQLELLEIIVLQEVDKGRDHKVDKNILYSFMDAGLVVFGTEHMVLSGLGKKVLKEHSPVTRHHI